MTFFSAWLAAPALLLMLALGYVWGAMPDGKTRYSRSWYRWNRWSVCLNLIGWSLVMAFQGVIHRQYEEILDRQAFDCTVRLMKLANDTTDQLRSEAETTRKAVAVHLDRAQTGVQAAEDVLTRWWMRTQR